MGGMPTKRKGTIPLATALASIKMGTQGTTQSTCSKKLVTWPREVTTTELILCNPLIFPSQQPPITSLVLNQQPSDPHGFFQSNFKDRFFVGNPKRGQRMMACLSCIHSHTPCG